VGVLGDPLEAIKRGRGRIEFALNQAVFCGVRMLFFFGVRPLHSPRCRQQGRQRTALDDFVSTDFHQQYLKRQITAIWNPPS